MKDTAMGLFTDGLLGITFNFTVTLSVSLSMKQSPHLGKFHLFISASENFVTDTFNIITWPKTASFSKCV